MWFTIKRSTSERKLDFLLPHSTPVKERNELQQRNNLVWFPTPSAVGTTRWIQKWEWQISFYLVRHWGSHGSLHTHGLQRKKTIQRQEQWYSPERILNFQGLKNAGNQYLACVLYCEEEGLQCRTEILRPCPVWVWLVQKYATWGNWHYRTSWGTVPNELKLIRYAALNAYSF